MKLSKLVLLAPLLAFALTAEAQAPVKPSARISAKTAATRTGQVDRFRTDYGSYDREFQREVRVEAEISTTGREKFSAVLRWFVVGKQMRSSRREVLRVGEMPVNVAPGGSTKVDVNSGPVASTDTNYAYFNERSTTGHRIDGWVLRLILSDGTELATATSSPETLTWLQTQPDWTAKLKAPPAN